MIGPHIVLTIKKRNPKIERDGICSWAIKNPEKQEINTILHGKALCRSNLV